MNKENLIQTYEIEAPLEVTKTAEQTQNNNFSDEQKSIITQITPEAKEILVDFFNSVSAFKNEVDNLIDRQEQAEQTFTIFQANVQDAFLNFAQKGFNYNLDSINQQREALSEFLNSVKLNNEPISISEKNNEIESNQVDSVSKKDNAIESNQEAYNQNSLENKALYQDELDSLPGKLNIEDLLIKTNPYEDGNYIPNLNNFIEKEDMKNFKNDNDVIIIDNSTHIPENIKLGVFSLSHCPGCIGLKNSLSSKGVPFINLQLDDSNSPTGRDEELSKMFDQNKAKYGYGDYVPQVIHIYDAGTVGDIKPDFESKQYNEIVSVSKNFISCKASKGQYCLSEFVKSYNDIINSTPETIDSNHLSMNSNTEII